MIKVVFVIQQKKGRYVSVRSRHDFVMASLHQSLTIKNTFRKRNHSQKAYNYLSQEHTTTFVGGNYYRRAGQKQPPRPTSLWNGYVESAII